MRKKLFVWSAAILLLMSVFTACRSGNGEEDGEYVLYFPVSRDISYGSALATQPWQGDGIPAPQELMEALLDGPTQEDLRAPFPRAVTILALELDEEEQLMRISLSEQYGGLTDMAQTLADACIVMTACQIPGVERVEISSEGFWASRPISRTLSPEELELDTPLP